MNSRLFESEIIGILKLFGLFIEIVLFVQLAPRVTGSSNRRSILLWLGFDAGVGPARSTDDLLVCRDVLFGPIDPASAQDVAVDLSA